MSWKDRPFCHASDGLQFFGQVDIDGDSAAMAVTLKDIAEQELYSVTLEPKA